LARGIRVAAQWQHQPGLTRQEAGSEGASLSGLPTPALVVDLDLFEGNLAAAEHLLGHTGKTLRPHIKAHRTPELALMQLCGTAARGVTCATVGEAEAMVAAGIDDVLVANEIVSIEKLERLAALAAEARVMVAVDSQQGAELVSR